MAGKTGYLDRFYPREESDIYERFGISILTG
jgi:hypothetical protein